MQEKEDKSLIYSVKEVSKLLRVSPGYVYSLINAGVLHAIKLGSLKICKNDLQNFLIEYNGYDLSNVHDIHPIDK